ELTHIFEYEILFQGKFGKTVTANPPQWLMEGLASFMAQDEDSKDRMVLRDAVVTDQIPAITRNPQGYFAYRFGHAVFKYMQQKYGFEGVRDFVYEYRNTLGSSIDKALKRAFDVTPEEFDTRFRTWLRKQYLPTLVAKGEPQEYGDPFRVGPNERSDEIAPSVSPSGDLLASFTTYKEDVDLALFNIPERKLLKNLSPGYTSRYEYFVAQSFTIGPTMGRDIGFAPDGDQIAVFVKKERGRNLLLLNPITGAIQKSVPMKVEQQLSPAYSPDGHTIAFSGFLGNQSDIFFYDLAAGVVTNITNDRFFDGAPVFSPDGNWLIYSSVVDGYAKLFRLNLKNPKERFQLTTGAWNDIDASYSPDGKRLFFASDKQTGRNIEEAAAILEKAEDKARREGDLAKVDPTNYAAYNIYSLDLASGDLLQYTDVVGGCFTPVVFLGQNNKERMVFASYYKRDWRLFSTPTDRPLHAAEHTTLASAPLQAESRTAFQPPVEVAIDDEKVEKASNRKLFVDDVEVNAGVSSDQLFVSRSVIYMSDMLGDRRFIASLDSVSSFSNFDFIYFDLHKRLNWGVRLYDNRSFFTARTTEQSRVGLNDRIRQQYRETGVMGILSYPFTRYHRVDFGAGYQSRQIAFPVLKLVGDQLQLDFLERRDNFPFLTTSFSNDNAAFKRWGPVSGHRYDVSYTFAPDIKNRKTLTSDVNIDARQYLQLSSRTLLAGRFFAGYSVGNFPNFYYFGGLNTVRGYDFRSIIGSKAGFANLEFRFPLIDVLATPILVFQQVRGNLFFDVGAASFKGQPFRFRQDGKLKDGVASVGYGLSFNFLGLELHWDVARRFDGKHTVGKGRSDIWIGETF
ncbi:MAG: BamA/TamA family outer membrane protein, partial [Acidobacteriota bacterium]